MSELNRQSSKKKVRIEVDDQMDILKNSYGTNVCELSYKLADQMYDSIRECDTDICEIAENLGFKADNIKNIKDYVFYNKHYLDRGAADEPVEYQRFDANIQQALAWKRRNWNSYSRRCYLDQA